MILTDYYHMEHLPGGKSATRYDCVKSTRSYPVLEEMRNKAGELFFYFHDVPDHFTAKAKRKADKAITKTKNISSIYVPDVNRMLGYGDMRETLDALLFVFSNDYTQMEIFVGRGQRNNRMALYQLLSDGELEADIKCLKEIAIVENKQLTTFGETTKVGDEVKINV